MRWVNSWRNGTLSDSLNRRITIQKKTITYDAYNQPIEEWTDEKTVWAAVINTGGGELYAAQKMYSETEVVFRVRQQNSVTVLNRIKFDNRTYEIIAINDVDAGHEEYQIAAKGVV